MEGMHILMDRSYILLLDVVLSHFMYNIFINL
jgi:hypothetical protein